MIQISKNVSLKLDFEPQQTPNGNWIRLSGIRKNESKPSIFLDKDNKVVNKYYKDKTEKSHWIYSFINIETDKIIEFEFDYYDNFLRIVK